MNNTTLMTNEEDKPKGLPYHMWVVFVYSIFLCVVGSIINITATAVTLSQTQRIQKLTSQNIFFINSCLTNLVFSLLTGDGARRLFTPYINYHFCRLRAFSVYVVMSNVVFSLVLLTLHRYFIIVHPQNTFLGFRTRVRAVCAVIVTWGLNLAVILFPLTGVWGSLGYSKENGTCTLKRTQSVTFARFFGILQVVLPFVVHAYCYSHVFYVIRRQNRKMIKVAPANSTASEQVQSKQQIAATKRQQQERRLTMVTFTMIVCYCLCTIPFAITSLSELNSSEVHFVGVLLLWSQVFINPTVYVLGDGNLRNVLFGRKNKNKTVTTQNTAE